jgi:hypothetical protein
MVAGKKTSKGARDKKTGESRCHNITLLQDCDISRADERPWLNPGTPQLSAGDCNENCNEN